MNNLCKGNGEEHCCWVNGKVCLYLEENTVEGRRWACGLRRELGDWDLVLIDQRYVANVAPTFEPLGINCKDWPGTTVCDTCGANR